MPTFESAQLRCLEYVFEANDQVYNANVLGEPVTDLVKSLIERFEPPPPHDPWEVAVGSDEPPF